MTAWKHVFVCLAATLIPARARAGQTLPLREPEYVSIPTAGAGPTGLTVGPLGDIWFTENRADRIGRIGLDLHVDEFPLPAQSSPPSPTAITLGPDDNLWFIEAGARKIGRITVNGTVTEFPLPSAFNLPLDLTGGPDGRLWFTELVAMRGRVDAGAVGNVTLNGTVNEMVIDAAAFSITRGPDDALWFTTYGLGRLATNGEHRVFSTHDLQTIDLTTGPDGALWFTYYRPGSGLAGAAGLPPLRDPPAIGRMTTDGVLTDLFIPDPDMQPIWITRGPEDNLWFTTEAGGIWRVNLAGTMEQITFNDADQDVPGDITAGADGRIWWTQPNTNRIGSVDSLFFLPLTLAGSTPIGLARGQDDSVWFADYGGNRIGRVDRDGSLRQHELGDGHNPTAVAVAPDGSAWFTNPGTETIGHITTGGDFIDLRIPSPPSSPQDIVLGPDGNFWFTEYAAGAIGRVTPRGVVTRFPISNLGLHAAEPRLAADGSHPVNIAVGPDGNLWFTDEGLNAIGRITTGGEIVEFPIPTADSAPAGITAGADGALYFVESDPGRVARVTTAGVVTELGTPDPDSLPQYITLGPDGALWFTESGANRLGRVARDGRITEFVLPVVDGGPTGIVGRGDGRLFVALLNTGQILYTDLAAAEPTHTVTPTAPRGSTPTETPEPTPTIRTLGCSGDCNGDATVSINELIAAVNIALGNASSDSCVNADADANGSVRINDLIAAVNSALQGCPL